MADLISQLRGMVAVGTADYAVGTANFWDDDQLALVLDHNRRDAISVLLQAEPTRIGGGTLSWNDYYAPQPWWEQTVDGSSVFVVRDGLGAIQGTAGWSADYRRGLVTFSTNRLGTIYYATGRIYDLYGSAADVLYATASTIASTITRFGEDGQTFELAGADGLRKQAAIFASQAWATTVRMGRSDTQTGAEKPYPDYHGHKRYSPPGRGYR